MSHTLELAKQLIAKPSITPHDAGCQSLLIHHLTTLGFTIETLPFGDVQNFWARRGNQAPLFAFVGHTDIVPPGPVEKWSYPPFEPIIKNGYLYGRGAADMKGSLAAMITACQTFIEKFSNHAGSIAFLITSDEEGSAINGTAKVIDYLSKRGEKIDWCLIGEPSSEKQLGDVIKNGRRGSLSGELRIHGKQGHIAYPHLASNPIHLALPALLELTTTTWDEGNTFFPPTSFQISNIHSGTGAGNVIPGILKILFNFRFSSAVTAEQLKQRTENKLRYHGLNYVLDWQLSGLPFFTPPGALVAACQQAIKTVTEIDTVLSTGGGTSDGRFIAPTGAQVIELGLCNESIHQIDERVRVAELDQLALIYQHILETLLSN